MYCSGMKVLPVSLGINIYKNNINLIFALKMKESMNLLIENKGRRLKALLVKIDIETHWSKTIKWKV